jgi:NitT/TauT family transport system permease protein
LGFALGFTPRNARTMTATQRLTDTSIVAIAILAIWQILHHIAGETALPGPATTLVYLAHNVPTARFIENAQATLTSFIYALVLAYGLGLAMGVWLGAHRLSGEVGEPLLVALYSIPKITLYPVILLMFGLGISGKVAFGALHGILPVALLTMAAIRNIPRVYLKAAQTMHLSRWQTITTVLFPATLPEVVSGLRIGLTVTLLGVLLAEMFASKRGLGFLVMNAMSTAQSEEMVSVAIVLFVFAVCANGLLLWMEHSLHRRVSTISVENNTPANSLS